jgi:tripartite ATP-independent transporter DctM subunit
MSNPEIGLVGIGALFLLLSLRLPIAVGLILVSVAGVYAIRGPRAALGSMATLSFDVSASWTLSAIPMFFLMGAFAFNSGMTSSVYRLCRMLFWWVPGGLAIASNLAGAAFGAVSGSSLAVTAVMAKIAIPEMLQRRYNKSLATSVVAASGTIDALIPPSIAIIIYGIEAEAPITDLFLAGITPGILTIVAYVALIAIRCRLDPSLAPAGTRDFTSDERRAAARESWPFLALFVAVFAGMYSGVATPTEAGAVSAALALLIAFARRQMSWRTAWQSLVESCVPTASIFFIIVGAAFFARFMSISGVPQYLGESIQLISPSPTMFILMMSAVIILMGMFLEGLAIMLIVLPLVLPICRDLGIDIVWVGLIIIKLVVLSLLHPPLGLQAFVVKSIVGDTASLATIYKGLLWFVGAEFLIIGLMIAFPDLSMWLPRLVKG